MQNHEKILQYEVFLSERLQPDLTAAQLQRSELEGQLKEYEDLQQNLKLLQEKGLTQLRTTVQLGGDVTMQADVPDTSKVLIKTGLGFWAECTLEEAGPFIEVHSRRLRARVARASALVANKRAHVQIVLQGLQELTGLAASSK